MTRSPTQSKPIFRRLRPAALLAFALVFCSPPAPAIAAEEQALARLGDATVSSRDFLAMLQRLSPAQRADLQEQRAALEQLLWQNLAMQVLARKAREEKWAEQAEVQAQVREAVRKVSDGIVGASYLRERTRLADNYPSEAELSAAFAKMSAPPPIPATYQLAQIFLERPEKGSRHSMDEIRTEAKRIAQQARNGDFAALAREHSQDGASAPNGGELPPMPLSGMRPATGKVVARLAVGEVSEPVETAQGLFIFKLLQKQPERAPTLAGIAPTLRAAMRAELKTRKERELLEAMAPKQQLLIDDKLLANLLQNAP